MTWRRWTIVAAALSVGGFMLFDGSRALLRGDYLTPRSGAYAGQLGPWAGVVSRVGIAPRGAPMKAAFVIFGLSWLIGLLALIRDPHRGGKALAVLAVATLWYVPLGTLVSLVILALVMTSDSPS